MLHIENHLSLDRLYNIFCSVSRSVRSLTKAQQKKIILRNSAKKIIDFFAPAATGKKESLHRLGDNCGLRGHTFFLLICNRSFFEKHIS
jgi:hypothetical protein